MWWKVGVEHRDDGVWNIYNYFKLVDINPQATRVAYKNPFTQTFVYPVTKEFVIKVGAAKSDEDWEAWYQLNKVV